MKPPDPEFCFATIQHWSTCMTKQEWSGWMQAIFSVAAIVFAVFMPFVHDWWKRKQDSEADKKRRVDSVRDVHDLMADAYANLTATTDGLIKGRKISQSEFERTMLTYASLRDGDVKRHLPPAIYGVADRILFSAGNVQIAMGRLFGFANFNNPTDWEGDVAIAEKALREYGDTLTEMDNWLSAQE